jgi:K+-sensing histidine kinase KdpD
MIIRNSKNWSPYSALDAFLWSAALFLIITAALISFGQAFYSAHTYKFYFTAATFLAYFFGFLPATIFVIGSSIFANYFFVAPYGEFIFTTHDLERYLINLFFGSIAIVLIEILQRERFKSKLLLLVSESRYLILLHRDNQLLNELKKKNNV